VEDDFEAVRASQRTRLEHERHVNGSPTPATMMPTPSTSTPPSPKPLPPRLAAALSTIISSTIQSILTAAEGSAIGSDVGQWRLKWADEICKVWNGAGEDEEYYRRSAVLLGRLMDDKSDDAMQMEKEELWAHPRHVLNSHSEHYVERLPEKMQLFLRLHNDDVHTFEEVIKALHGKNAEPIAVPVGGVGSIGDVGGAGVSGEELKTLTNGDDAGDIGIGTNSRSLRNRPLSEDSTTSHQQRRAFRSSDSTNSSGASSPTWNRSPVNSSASPTAASAAMNSDLNAAFTLGAAPPSTSELLEYELAQYTSEVDPSSPLVPQVSTATDLTRKVDADGQVLVRTYQTLNAAGIGFSRLRQSAGLHCAVLPSSRMEGEERAKVLLEWLGGLIGSHPCVASLVVQCLVDVTEGEDVLCHTDDDGDDDAVEKNNNDGMSKGVAVWSTPRMMPCWSGTNENWWSENKGADADAIPAWRRRLDAFPPHLESSYLTREEGRELFRQGIMLGGEGAAERFFSETGADPDFYANVPYSLPDNRLRKSPHALWGMLPTSHLSKTDTNDEFTHPLLRKFTAKKPENAKLMGSAFTDDDNETDVYLQSRVYVVDTDLRKHEEGEHLTSSLFPHKMAGLNLVSGVAHVDQHGSSESHYFGNKSTGVTTIEHSKQLASCSSFVAPASPVLLLLLLDPYSPKQLRSALHRLFLSLLTDSRFKSRFAASLGAVVYRPTSTLFCAGIGTEADTLLGFTVQLFTTGSLVKALGNLDATMALLCREDKDQHVASSVMEEKACVFALPIAHSVVRSIHSNILGATKEVSVVVKNNINEILNGGDESTANDRTRSGGSMSTARSSSNNIPALVYQYGSEHPLSTRLPGAPDDKFIDSRCMKHKRLPLLLRDLEYIYETPGTAVKLLRSSRSSSSTSNTPSASPTSGDATMNDNSVTPSPSFTASPTNIISSNSLATYNIPNALDFPAVWARLLRLGQGIDLQKRRISGGHVEFEDERWLGAYGLSLNLSSTGDALSESPFSGVNYNAMADNHQSLVTNREAMGNLFAAFFREIKMWLYREGLLETGLSRPASRESGELEALQRSTLHVSISQLDESSVNQIVAATGVTVAQSADVACEKGVKNLPEAKLSLLEAAILHERTKLSQSAQSYGTSSSHGPVMGDWLKVPHSPLAGDGFSFHLPLHRSLARSILCFCSAVVPTEERQDTPDTWWRLPLLDDDDDFASDPSEAAGIVFKQDSMSALVRSTHKSSNFRVVWSSGPECSAPEAQLRKSRSRMLSALLASTKVVHSLCDHPLRCIAASQQIDHHMWAKNGGSVAGMALNYGSVPLCRSLRDLDLTMVQMSASGFNVGLGARRVFSLLTNRFSMDGYLCDPDRRNSFGRVGWVKPPRMQEMEHAELLAESFFTTLCVIVSDLPAPPPTSLNDNSVLRQNLRRELLHALAVEPRSHSEAMSAASAAVSRRDESDGGIVGSGGGASSFRAVFTEVLQSIGQQRKQGSRSSSGPPMFELKPEGSHEYDPSYYHLRKTEHQHAMDNIARLRRQKLEASASSKGMASIMVLPLVAKPPQAHPRFMSSRLLLHLPSMYAAIRRYLMYALFNGSWLPPSQPEPEDMTITVDGAGDVAVLANPGSGLVGANRTEAYRRAVSSASNRSSLSTNVGAPHFSPETVAASSKSFLEVLHILTLQVHTLEECSSLFKALPFLDHEHKVLSSGIDINSYLGQLVAVPNSLINVWALQCAPYGPLPSEGSGENRGSVLGLLIALYEHRDNAKSTGVGQKSANDDHGGARVLSADGLKWLLRFVSALVEGAENVTAACQSATSGIPVDSISFAEACDIHPEIRAPVKEMLANLPGLWPSEEAESSVDAASSAANEKSKEAQNAAKARALAKMKKLQSSFAASIATQFNDDSEKKLVDADEENLCIICKCDDADGDNGPIGYLGHVQRSRVAQLASKSTLRETGNSENLDLNNIYRVVGDKGCQLRSTESMESAPVAFLARGSIVEVLQSKISPQLGLLSRRVLVRQVSSESQNGTDEIVQGWASIQSWQGYIILSPLSSLCYTNTRWGPTRPIIRQCGHAAHLRCVEAHCLSLQQRAYGNQPYDGRFSANISDGEFLCPLCKQLSNILIPEDSHVEADDSASYPQALTTSAMCEDKEGFEIVSSPVDISLIRNILVRTARVSYSEASSKSEKATHQYGSSLSQAMQLSSDNVSTQRRKEREYWHPALRRWDFEDNDLGDGPQLSPQIGSILRLMRQQLISWAAVGHSAAAAEASGRGSRQVMFGEVSYSSKDPWSDYTSKGRDSHPRLLELRRTLAATASLFDVITFEVAKQLGTNDEKAKGESVSIFGSLISDILEGQHWMVNTSNTTTENEWRVVTSIIASMMCHVSKEDTVAPRLEARAVAAAMWTITGSMPTISGGSSVAMNLDSSPEVEVSAVGNIGNQDIAGLLDDSAQNDISTSQPRPVLPPKPLSVRRVEKNLAVELEPKWGTSDPFKVESNTLHQTPFRPAVASAFLYVPLLAWDLNILAGAVFSSLLSNGKSNPCVSSYELLQSAKVLLVGRLIQVLSTPDGFLTSNNAPQDDYDDFDEDQFWDDAKKRKEATAIKALLLFCRKPLTGAIEPGAQDLNEKALLQNVGNAILPFCRTLILLLRASTSAIRQRHRRNTKSGLEETQADKAVAKMVEDPDTMTIEDGFQLLDVIGAPLPSSILEVDSSHSSWISLVARWLTALAGFEEYHGTRGNGLIFDEDTKAWTSVGHDYVPASESSPRAPSLQNLHVETSSAAVEVAHLPPQGDGMNGDYDDSDVDFEEGSEDLSSSVSNEDEVMEIVDEALAADSDEELENVDMDVDFGEIDSDFEDPGMDDFGAETSNQQELDFDVDDASDVNADLSEPDGSKISSPNDRMFSYVSRSAIIPYQPSILGTSQVGPGPRGARGELFEYKVANSVMKDLSHLGSVHLPGAPLSCLVKLPKSFVELYSMVNRVKGRDSRADDTDDDGGFETAICLLTGAVMRSGTIRRMKTSRPPGTCTMHARKVGSGIGVFFLVQKCTILLMHNNKSAYSPSLYVDEHGEEDVGLRRGRPLFFSEERYQALETMWRTHGIPREVSQIRSTSDRVIRDNWY